MHVTPGVMSNLGLINSKQNCAHIMPQLKMGRYYVHVGNNPKCAVCEMAESRGLLLA